jgi:hypothetical protein
MPTLELITALSELSLQGRKLYMRSDETLDAFFGGQPERCQKIIDALSTAKALNAGMDEIDNAT